MTFLVLQHSSRDLDVNMTRLETKLQAILLLVVCLSIRSGLPTEMSFMENVNIHALLFSTSVDIYRVLVASLTGCEVREIIYICKQKLFE